MGGVSVWERTRADQGKAGGRSAGGYFLVLTSENGFSKYSGKVAAGGRNRPRFAIQAHCGLLDEVAELTGSDGAIVGCACPGEPECVGAVVGEQVAHIAVLRRRASGDIYGIEAQIRRGRPIDLAPQGACLGRDAGVYARLYRIHHRHRFVVAYLVNLPSLVEVEKRKLFEMDAHFYATPWLDGVVGRLHDKIFKLTYNIAFTGVGAIRRHIDANHYGGSELRGHNIYGEIVVNAAVVHHASIYLGGVEHQWETHRSPDGIAERT